MNMTTNQSYGNFTLCVIFNDAISGCSTYLPNLRTFK